MNLSEMIFRRRGQSLTNSGDATFVVVPELGDIAKRKGKNGRDFTVVEIKTEDGKTIRMSVRDIYSPDYEGVEGFALTLSARTVDIADTPDTPAEGTNDPAAVAGVLIALKDVDGLAAWYRGHVDVGATRAKNLAKAAIERAG